MFYYNLHSLISSSSSARRFFVSLPVSQQLLLHEQNDYIHTSQQLHRAAELLSVQSRQEAISKLLGTF